MLFLKLFSRCNYFKVKFKKKSQGEGQKEICSSACMSKGLFMNYLCDKKNICISIVLVPKSRGEVPSASPFHELYNEFLLLM